MMVQVSLSLAGFDCTMTLEEDECQACEVIIVDEADPSTPVEVIFAIVVDVVLYVTHKGGGNLAKVAKATGKRLHRQQQRGR